MNDNVDRPEAEQVTRFDFKKAEQMRAQALDAFRAKHRTTMRLTGGYLIVLISMAWVCLRLFNRAVDVQSWIFYGVLFLLLFESTVLIKLWYRLMHSKLELLRELKSLRMDLALQRDDFGALQEAARTDPKFMPSGTSTKESYAWQVIILVLGLLIGVEIVRHGPGVGGWLSFRRPLLNVSGEVAPGQTNVFHFVPSGRLLMLNLRADTQQGTVSYNVIAPDGHRIGNQTGGGLTVQNWMLDVPDAGTYTLQVISREAIGRWQVQIDEPDANKTPRAPNP